MPAESSKFRFLRVSLRELLLISTLIPIGCATLKLAGQAWWLALSSFTLPAFMAAAVVALVGRGPGQAFARGFVVCVGIYAALLALAPQKDPFALHGIETDPYEGLLPTTRLMRHPFELMVRQQWTDSATGEVIPDYDPSQAGSGGGFGPPPVQLSEIPNRRDFMMIAHLLWALSLGYLGGRFGRVVHSHRRE